MRTTITRRIEFDAGHRIPDHQSKCRNVHGHRYALEVTITGPINAEAGSAEQGMVMDFYRLRTIMDEEVHAPWDHAFLCWHGDKDMRTALLHLGTHRTVLLESIPTVENLAELIAERMKRRLENTGTHLVKVTLWETPNCFSEIVTGI